jgi:hypothetical protein
MINLNTNVEQTPVPAARVQLTAISAAGVNDAAALARQQLPNAVPAPALIAAYSANVPQQPKPPARPQNATPSSALAAQFIAQGALNSEEDLNLFTPRSASTVTQEVGSSPADDYLVALKVARGEVTAVQSKPTPQAQKLSSEAGPTSQSNQADVANGRPMTNAAFESLARTVVAQAASGLPALFVQFMRAPSIATARGFSAYQIAQARNASIRSAALTN